jgi:hypothetical protein
MEQRIDVYLKGDLDTTLVTRAFPAPPATLRDWGLLAILKPRW